jgi:hypothetical protein
VGEWLLPNDAKVYRINLWSVIPIEVAPLSSSLAPWLARYHLETKTLDTPWNQHYEQGTSVTWKTYQVSSYHPMHAIYQITTQILSLAYTTQACIKFKTCNAMQASTWLCTYQMQTIKVDELALPTCVLLFSKNFDPSQFLNVAPSLSIILVQIPNCNIFVSISPLCHLFP